MKPTTSLISDDLKGGSSKPSKEDGRRHATSKEAIGNKYAAMREQMRHANTQPVEDMSSTKVSLLDAGSSGSSGKTAVQSSGLASKWESMKNGFQSFKANMGAKKFLPLRQMQETKLVSRNSSSESLDEIFQRLKRPSIEHGNRNDEDEGENGLEIKVSRPAR